jgi:hypothetical protein
MKTNLAPFETQKTPHTKKKQKFAKIPFLRIAVMVLFFIGFFFVINCSKTNTQNIIYEDITFNELSIDPKVKSNDLVLIGYKTDDTAVFTIDKKRLLQGLQDDITYKYFFDDNTTFTFFIESIQPAYTTPKHIYLTAKGKAYEQTGNREFRFTVGYELQPDDKGNLYNVYTTTHLCKTSNCSDCFVLWDGGFVSGCDCLGSGLCTHEIAAKDKGGYFILPIKK